MVVSSLVVISMLWGCTAAGVLETDDPYKKLAQAEEAERTGRIAISQRLLLEAIEIFEKGDDYPGLAEAYRRYGFLLRIYGEETVIDRDPSSRSLETTNEDGRQDKAIAYFEYSLRVSETHGLYGLVTNLHYVIGQTQFFAGRQKEACLSFDASLAAYRTAAEKFPDREVELPSGFSSYQEFIAVSKEEIGCPA